MLGGGTVSRKVFTGNPWVSSKKMRWEYLSDHPSEYPVLKDELKLPESNMGQPGSPHPLISEKPPETRNKLERKPVRSWNKTSKWGKKSLKVIFD